MRPFTLDINWQNIITRNGASTASKQSSGATSPANQLSSELSGSRVTRSQLALQLGSGRKDADKAAVSSASCQNSAANAVPAENASGSRQSGESKAGFSAARAASGNPESSLVTGASRKEASKTAAINGNLHSVNRRNSGANALSSERAKRSTKSRPNVLAVETNLRETRSGLVTVSTGASDTPGNVETVAVGRDSLRRGATGSSSLSKRSGKRSGDKRVVESATNRTKDVNSDGNEMPDRSEDHSIQLVPVQGTAIRSSASAGNRILSAVAELQPTVTPSSSEPITSEQVSSRSDIVTSTATVNVMTSGKKVPLRANQSNAASTRTRSVTQNRQTATSAQALSPSEAVITAADRVVSFAAVDVMISVPVRADQSNAASTRTRSVTQNRQTATSAHTSSPAEAVITAADRVVSFAAVDVMTSGKKVPLRANQSNAASTRTRSVTQNRRTATSAQVPSQSEAVITAANHVISFASVDVMTAGKKVPMRANQSNAASTRTRSVTQNRQTATNAHTSSPTEAVATAADGLVVTANTDVMTSGRKVKANQSNAASTRTRSVTQNRQIATNARTSSPTEAVAIAADSLVATANTDVMTTGKKSMANGTSLRARSVTVGRQTPAPSAMAFTAAAANTQPSVR